jgi:homoserine kinase type II
MLWESVDPVEQLAKRFGFRDGSSAAEWAAESCRRHWGLEVTRCDRLVISAWNAMAWVVADDRRLIVKWSALPQVFARLVDAARVTAWLDARGIPVACPLPAAEGSLLVEVCGDESSSLPLPDSRFLVGVLPVIEGELLDVDDPAQVADAGQMLAAVHEALASYPDGVGSRRPKRHEQLIHNDFRSANILHDGSKITAVLDLEEICYGTRVADLSKAAVLLSTRYRDWAPTSPPVRGAFVDAYNASAPLAPEEQRELDERIAELVQQAWI